MPVLNRIQIRRGTLAPSANQWTSEVLYAGELGYEADTGKFKIGDGITAWGSLAYASVTPSELTELVQDIIGTNVVAGSGISVNYNDTNGNTTISLNNPTVKVSDITDLTASATELNYMDGATPGTAIAGAGVVLDSNKDLQGLRNLTLDGNLTVNGTTVTVNSTTLTIDDKNIELGTVANPTDITADGGGITLKGDNDIQWKWINATQSWTSTEHINVDGSSLTYKINGVTVLGDSKIGASGYSLASGVIIDGGTP
jgi:Tfp pilus assembly major pilin PilA